MDFKTSVETYFKKFADFKGRASRSEFWYFYLFSYGTIGLLAFLSYILIRDDFYWWLLVIFIVVIIVPLIAVTARRLHDLGKSGWWQLITVIPYLGIIGQIFLIVWWCSEGEKKKNKFGAPIKLK